MEENLLGHSPLDSNKLDHMVTSNADPTLSGAHSHLTRHIQGTDFKIVFISLKEEIRLPVNAILCNFCIFLYSRRPILKIQQIVDFLKNQFF